ncbi:hypothetical protein VTL71DRAFT_5966 [Oculimacula yallundae]|uniref:Uncharacterized protein n=1 Tax=Oculimacula yallundae TaxID=86028 RepID=A0ABR4BZ03_9HELO
MATTVVQATQHVLVESATSVVSSLSAAAVAEFKTLETGVAQEVVSATDDNVSNILHKVEGAVKVVAHEVADGVVHVVETVKQHPELIAEGVLAVAIGVASLVQPELIAGEIAILGKMAADSAKKTVTQIASEEGEKIVTAISKDLADDAKIEAEKDKLQAEEKKKAEGGEVAVKEEVPKTAEEKNMVNDNGEKTISIEIQTPVAKVDEAPKTGSEKDAAPVELKITIGSDGQIKAVSKSVVEEPKPAEKTVVPVVAEQTEVPALVSQETCSPLEKSLKPEEVSATKLEPIAAAASLIPDNPAAEASQSEPLSSDTPNLKETSIPIILEVPLATESRSLVDLTVETKETNSKIKVVELPISMSAIAVDPSVDPSPRSMADEAPGSSEKISGPPIVDTPKEMPKETTQPEILAVLGIVHHDVVEEPANIMKAVVQAPEKTEETFVQQLLHRPNSEELIDPLKAATKTISAQQQASVEPVPDSEQVPKIIARQVVDLREEKADDVSSQPVKGFFPTTSEVIGDMKIPVTPGLPPSVEAINQNVPNTTSASLVAEVPSTSPIASQAKELAVAALENNSTESGSTIVTAATSITQVTETTMKTIEVPSSAGVKMVTVSQESLDILHSKLDAMHEAIQLITKTLALHLPVPPSPVSAIPKAVEVAPSPALQTQKIPEPVVQEQVISTDAQPILTTPLNEATPNKTTSPPLETPILPETLPVSPQSTVPKRPTHVKRGSVIGSIGKFLWPFGGAPPPSKDTTIQVSTLEVAAEVEVQIRPKIRAPGLGSTKAVSTVEVTEVQAMPMAA